METYYVDFAKIIEIVRKVYRNKDRKEDKYIQLENMQQSNISPEVFFKDHIAV